MILKSTMNSPNKSAELSRNLMQIAKAKSEHEAGQSKPAAQVFDELKTELKEKNPDAHFWNKDECF